MSNPTVKSRSILSLALAYIAPLIAIAGPGNYNQQGPKLAGAGAGGQGFCVSISADGNTALFSGILGAWVFTKSNGVWTQQGGELVPSDITTIITPPLNLIQPAVTLSGDGNTAAVAVFSGLPNERVPVAWVFTRSFGVWTQQGGKLIGNERRGSDRSDIALVLSGDGNTLVLGDPQDGQDLDSNENAIAAGVVWVFTRSSGIWAEQAVFQGGGNENLGKYVAITPDGKTLAISDGGGVNLLTLSGRVWKTSQPVLFPPQGSAQISLTRDGNTLLTNGYFYQRKNGVLTLAGPRLLDPTGAYAATVLSSDGSTALGSAFDKIKGPLIDLYVNSGGNWGLQNSYTDQQQCNPGVVRVPLAVSASGNTMIESADGDPTNRCSEVTGGGAWIFASPQLSTSLTHSGNFSHGQTNAKYTITVKNIGDREIHAAPTSAVNVIDKLPAGLIATAISGPGWTCALSSVSCTRQDGLGIGASFPPVTVTVTVASSAASKVTNVATASGGGSNWGNANDVTFIIP